MLSSPCQIFWLHIGSYDGKGEQDTQAIETYFQGSRSTNKPHSGRRTISDSGKRKGENLNFPVVPSRYWKPAPPLPTKPRAGVKHRIMEPRLIWFDPDSVLDSYEKQEF